MLRARVLSNGIGMLCPEIFAGDDGDQSEIPSPSISLTQPSAPAVESRPAAAPVVVEAEVIKESPVVPSPAPSPVQQAAPPVAPQPVSTVAPAATQPSQPATASTLPEELVARLEEAIGEHAMVAGKWLVKEGWIKPGESLANLSEARAQRILKQTASFIRAVTGGVQ